MTATYNILEALLLVTALSMDAFVSSFAYGANKIKIPFKSVIVIDIICTSILAISIFLGIYVSPNIPELLTKTISFFILFILGIIKLFDGTIKILIRKYNKLHKKIKFSIFDLNFVLNIYANPQDADIDSSRILSPKESIYLAIALSIDGLAVGFGAGLTDINYFLIIIFSLLSHIIAIMLGCCLGNKIAEKSSLNLSWLSGLILIVLSILKL